MCKLVVSTVQGLQSKQIDTNNKRITLYFNAIQRTCCTYSVRVREPQQWRDTAQVSVDVPSAVGSPAQAGDAQAARWGTARHLVVKRELFSGGHASLREEGNPLQTLVEVVYPNGEDDQVGVALRERRLLERHSKVCLVLCLHVIQSANLTVLQLALAWWITSAHCIFTRCMKISHF